MLVALALLGLGTMKFAPKIIFLVRDPNGFGPSIFNSLIPKPESNLTKSEETLELSLADYGITDQKVSIDLINFVDPQRSPQVSLLLLPNYGPPIAACAVREVLASITSENHSDQLTIVVPFVLTSLKFNKEVMNLPSSKQEITLYAAEIGGTTDYSQSITTGITSISSSLQLKSEPLACLLHMVRVLRIPTVILLAADGLNQSKRLTDHELEALCKVGQLLAGRLGLNFCNDGFQHVQVERPQSAQEPWRALYL